MLHLIPPTPGPLENQSCWIGFVHSQTQTLASSQAWRCQDWLPEAHGLGKTTGALRRWRLQWRGAGGALRDAQQKFARWKGKETQRRSDVVQSLSRVWLSATPRTAARQASLAFTISQSLLKLMSIESVMPSNHLIFRHPLLLPSKFPSIGVFSMEVRGWCIWASGAWPDSQETQLQVFQMETMCVRHP